MFAKAFGLVAFVLASPLAQAQFAPNYLGARAYRLTVDPQLQPASKAPEKPALDPVSEELRMKLHTQALSMELARQAAELKGVVDKSTAKLPHRVNDAMVRFQDDLGKRGEMTKSRVSTCLRTHPNLKIVIESAAGRGSVDADEALSGVSADTERGFRSCLASLIALDHSSSLNVVARELIPQVAARFAKKSSLEAAAPIMGENSRLVAYSFGSMLLMQPARIMPGMGPMPGSTSVQPSGQTQVSQ